MIFPIRPDSHRVDRASARSASRCGSAARPGLHAQPGPGQRAGPRLAARQRFRVQDDPSVFDVKARIAIASGDRSQAALMTARRVAILLRD